MAAVLTYSIPNPLPHVNLFIPVFCFYCSFFVFGFRPGMPEGGGGPAAPPSNPVGAAVRFSLSFLCGFLFLMPPVAADCLPLPTAACGRLGRFFCRLLIYPEISEDLACNHLRAVAAVLKGNYITVRYYIRKIRNNKNRKKKTIHKMKDIK